MHTPGSHALGEVQAGFVEVPRMVLGHILRNKSSTPTSSEAMEALWDWGGVGGSGQEQMVISSRP